MAPPQHQHVHEQPDIEGLAAAVTAAEAPQMPWWGRLRWRPTSRDEAVRAERRLLGLLQLPWRADDVRVSDASAEHTMHTIRAVAADDISTTTASSGSNAPPPPVVLCPGYGAGSGFWFRSLDGVARAFPRTFAVDWLGTGLSGRPRFTGTDRASTEDFFLDSFEAWRQKVGLERFVLVGHSLGGYLAASYALRHPERVAHLVLVGPAGIPPKPEGWEQRLLSEPWSLRSQLFKLAARAWEAGVTPGGVIRALGPWGPSLIERYVNGRFTVHGGEPLRDDTGERQAFCDYFFHISSQRGSGEYALRHLLAPGAWAHAPLSRRLRELSPRVPVTLIYGEHDWMQPAEGKRLAAQLDALRPRRVATDHDVLIVPNAGHQVFVEDGPGFTAALLKALAPHLPRGVGERLAAEELQRAAARRLQRQLEEEGQEEGAAAAARQAPAPDVNG